MNAERLVILGYGGRVSGFVCIYDGGENPEGKSERALSEKKDGKLLNALSAFMIYSGYICMNNIQFK